MNNRSKDPVFDTTDCEALIFTGGLVGMSEPMPRELRLDAANGLHKFLWISRGSGRMLADGVVRGFTPSTAIYVPPNVPHSFEAQSQVQGMLVSVHPDADIQYPTRLLMVSSLHITDQNQTSARFEALMREEASKGLFKNHAMLHLAGILALQLKRLEAIEKPPKKSTASTRLLTKFSKLLEADYKSGKPLADYAAVLGVTPTHLTRVCQKTNNKSASDMIQDRVLTEAMFLLRQDNRKIRFVAEELGFSSAAYFTRFFSSKVGKTPREFKNRDRNLIQKSAPSKINSDRPAFTRPDHKPSLGG